MILQSKDWASICMVVLHPEANVDIWGEFYTGSSIMQDGCSNMNIPCSYDGIWPKLRCTSLGHLAFAYNKMVLDASVISLNALSVIQFWKWVMMPQCDIACLCSWQCCLNVLSANLQLFVWYCLMHMLWFAANLSKAMLALIVSADDRDVIRWKYHRWA